jgi:N-acetylmuramoyl-L-alanine amidase
MTKWRNDFVVKNKYTRPGTLLNGVKKIVLHWTANPGASAENHQRYFNGSAIENKRTASAHIFVDSKEAVCIVPLNEVAYHANDNAQVLLGKPYRGVDELKPNANKLSIGVEMCVEDDETISPATVQRTVEVIAELCKIYSLTEKDIVRHYDVTHKNCPSPFVRNSSLFDDFKKGVGDILHPPVYPGILLKTGSKGENVERIQKALNVPVTGVFDGVTLRALKEFQKANGLVSDGIVGVKTWSKLF